MSSAQWFFAPPSDWTESEITLPTEESHHATRVLRIAPPDMITVMDGKGTVARCAAAHESEGRLVCEILESDTRRRPRPEIVVYQGAPKGTKADEVVERLAELGVAEVVVFDSERTVVRWDDTKLARLHDRWDAIARATAKQSRNPYLTVAGAGASWTELLRRVAKEPLAVALWEEASLPLRVALEHQPDRIALIIGPEGGLSREEAASLADSGAQLVSLGPQILRTEIAAVVATSATLFHYGLIG